jgi:hypothetical protein
MQTLSGIILFGALGVMAITLWLFRRHEQKRKEDAKSECGCKTIDLSQHSIDRIVNEVENMVIKAWQAWEERNSVGTEEVKVMKPIVCEWNSEWNSPIETAKPTKKRGRGRPKGSKNKPKGIKEEIKAENITDTEHSYYYSFNNKENEEKLLQIKRLLEIEDDLSMTKTVGLCVMAKIAGGNKSRALISLGDGKYWDIVTPINSKRTKKVVLIKGG